MTKVLIFNGEQFQAEKIIKDEATQIIIGQNANGGELFRFSGIKDFTQFILDDDQTFDTPTPSTAETLANLTYELMNEGAI